MIHIDPVERTTVFAIGVLRRIMGRVGCGDQCFEATRMKMLKKGFQNLILGSNLSVQFSLLTVAK